MSINSFKAYAGAKFGVIKPNLIRPNTLKPSKKALRVEKLLLLNYMIFTILNDIVFTSLSNIIFTLLFSLLNLIKLTNFGVTDFGAKQ